MNRSLGSLISFIYMGILLVLTAAGIVLFSWLLLVGAVAGVCLYALTWIYLRFFSPARPPRKVRKFSGRIIEQDDRDSE